MCCRPTGGGSTGTATASGTRSRQALSSVRLQSAVQAAAAAAGRCGQTPECNALLALHGGRRRRCLCSCGSCSPGRSTSWQQIKPPSPFLTLPNLFLQWLPKRKCSMALISQMGSIASSQLPPASPNVRGLRARAACWPGMLQRGQPAAAHSPLHCRASATSLLLPLVAAIGCGCC